MFFVAGTIAENLDGKIVGKGDIKAQTRQVLENIKAVIESVVGTLSDVTRTTVYLTDFDNYFGMNELRV